MGCGNGDAEGARNSIASYFQEVRHELIGQLSRSNRIYLDTSWLEKQCGALRLLFDPGISSMSGYTHATRARDFGSDATELLSGQYKSPLRNADLVIMKPQSLSSQWCPVQHVNRDSICRALRRKEMLYSEDVIRKMKITMYIYGEVP